MLNVMTIKNSPRLMRVAEAAVQVDSEQIPYTFENTQRLFVYQTDKNPENFGKYIIFDLDKDYEKYQEYANLSDNYELLVRMIAETDSNYKNVATLTYSTSDILKLAMGK